MSLRTALYTASSALQVNSAQTATVSRNIAGASEKNYAARLSLVETTFDGSVETASVSRATNAALQNAMLTSTSVSSANSAVSSALDSLQQTIGDPASRTSPSALMNALQNSLTQAASAPQNASSLTAAVGAAQSLATALNSASGLVQNTRAQADSGMATSVASINSLLNQFGVVNAAIVAGTQMGADVSNALDQRDGILSNLASQIGITAIAGKNGDMSIFTDSGATLFQGGARSVTMTPTPTFTAGTSGAAVYVDGVAVTGPSATMPIQSGALAGLAQIRDVDAPKYQMQLDETARGLISAFAQTDQSATPTAPARSGLFAWPGSPTIPNGLTSGLAGQIEIDPSVNPTAGGNVNLLRDGGIGSGDVSAYVYNSSGAQAFSDRLTALSNALNTTQSFDSSTGLSASSSVSALALNSDAWLEAARQGATNSSTQSGALATQATSALSNATGVNIDDQMSQMLNLENSYQASAKMIASVDTMYSSLFSALSVA